MYRIISPISVEKRESSKLFKSLNEVGSFENTFNSIINNFSAIFPRKEYDIEKSVDWLKIVMSYNVPQGKQIRGRMVELAYKTLVPEATNNQVELARILGWCVEILQASFLVADDIMDKGETRRGRPCWYRVQNLGAAAINDAFLLEHFAFQLLRFHFGKMDVYTDLLDLFLGVSFKTILGQSLDTRMERDWKFEDYSESLYRSIVVYKTSYYTVYLPIALAMTLAGISKRDVNNNDLWNSVEEISKKIGTLFQVQDDYFDCFADEQILGKVGTDIQDGKCSWLFLQAKEISTTAECQILKENYGKWDPSSVARVKDLYSGLNLPTLFTEYQENEYKEILKLIGSIKNTALQNILVLFLERIYKRLF